MNSDRPSTALVEKKARFLVSRGFSLVKSGLRDCGSDSPVNDELSTCIISINIISVNQHLSLTSFTYSLHVHDVTVTSCL